MRRWVIAGAESLSMDRALDMGLCGAMGRRPGRRARGNRARMAADKIQRGGAFMAIRRIGILGAGAIGSVVGGLLTRAGHDVTLVDQWPEHVEAMRARGLRLSGTIGDLTVPVRALHIHELQTVTEPFDAMFVAV